MPGVERPSIDDTKVRSIARDRLPGVAREASTADVSVSLGNSASAWETRNDQSVPTSLDLGRGFAEPAEVGCGLGQGGVVGIGRRADHGRGDFRRRRSKPRSAR